MKNITYLSLTLNINRGILKDWQSANVVSETRYLDQKKNKQKNKKPQKTTTLCQSEGQSYRIHRTHRPLTDLNINPEKENFDISSLYLFSRKWDRLIHFSNQQRSNQNDCLLQRRRGFTHFFTTYRELRILSHEKDTICVHKKSKTFLMNTKQCPLSVHSIFCMWKPTSCTNLHIINKLIKILLTDILIVINKINVFMWGYKDNFLNTSLKCKHYLCCFMTFFYSVGRNYDFVHYLSPIAIFLKPKYSNVSFTI